MSKHTCQSVKVSDKDTLQSLNVVSRIFLADSTIDSPIGQNRVVNVIETYNVERASSKSTW